MYADKAEFNRELKSTDSTANEYKNKKIEYTDIENGNNSRTLYLN